MLPFLKGSDGKALALKVSAQPHNNLLVSILNLFDVPMTRFGHQNYCTGPAAGLV